MRINFDVTGDRRKSLAGAVSSALNAPTKYLGMPSAAYQIGDYTLSKTGELTGPDDRELVAALRAAHGFEPVNEAYDGAEPDIDPHNPGRYADPSEPPTAEMLKQAEEWMEEADAAQANAAQVDAPDALDRLTIEVPLQGFTPEKLNNLTRMVAAKAPLLKLALQKKRVTAREKAVPENAKYQFRCFLLSIGMIGDEYKTARKVLISTLSGSSAWKDGQRKEAVDDDLSR